MLPKYHDISSGLDLLHLRPANGDCASAADGEAGRPIAGAELGEIYHSCRLLLSVEGSRDCPEEASSGSSGDG